MCYFPTTGTLKIFPTTGTLKNLEDIFASILFLPETINTISREKKVIWSELGIFYITFNQQFRKTFKIIKNKKYLRNSPNLEEPVVIQN